MGNIRIGNLKLENRYLLAPMADVNDIAFRLLCKKAGCGLVYTGMVNPLTKQELILDDKPALQIFSTSERGVEEFIKKYEKKVSLFDFNLGCPAKTAKDLGFGSFMHDKLEVIENILKIMKKSTKKPISIKLRKSDDALKIAKIAEKYCDAICIHPRTASQGYSGIPDIKFAEKLKKNLSIPVIYSGNVNAENADEFLKTFDFVMIGREAMGNPEIFAKLQGKKIKIDFKDYIALAEKYNLKFSQIKMQALNFTKAKKNAKELRRQIVNAKSVLDIEKIEGLFS
ncbi:MAG: tRNA-dihydrouridine synthase [Nanoarchaeota archaeon]|nr:tRNA-dihydrouridine synthase [Nanoarchaeota archaeon]